MTVTIRIGIIFVASFVSCVHLRQFCSSYFTFSHLKQSRPDTDTIAEFKADTELTCALRCNTREDCTEATFNRDSKKCFLYQKKEKGSIDSHASEDNTRSRIVSMKKIKMTIDPMNKNNGSCASADDNKHNIDNHDDEKNEEDDNDNDDGDDDGDSRNLFPSMRDGGKNRTKGTSCSDILQQNSSSPTGLYNITIGNVTWKTMCRMNGIPGCGDGAWALVMSINGSGKTFSYDSHQWTSKASYQTAAQGKETKLPGYWLSSFTKICVKMKFPSRDHKASILLNLTATSLHSAIHDGITKMWKADFSTMKQFSWTPRNIDTSCFVQGFNIIAQHPTMTIKSHIGVQSQTQKCNLPYLVRGVGIGYQLSQGNPDEISCGEIISNPPNNPETHPAFCRIYIQ